jgi:deoxyhypusine synthase
MGTITLPKHFKSKYPHRFSGGKEKFLCGKRILPKPITGKETLEALIDNAFLAYNAARLGDACRLFTEKMLAPRTTVGMSLAGALTPAGLGASVIIPLIKAGFVDWIVATGANLYHDMHHALNFPLYRGSPYVSDRELRKVGVVRIYDILLDYNTVLMQTDTILRQILRQPEFQKEMGTAELHYLLGKYCAAFEDQLGLKDASMLAAAYRAGVPCFCPSPGDSTIGMNIAGVELEGSRLRVNPSIDVNETTAIVLGTKRSGGRSAVVLVGGGSPKNFTLQTEPQIQEVLRINEMGHDYFLQFTDARPDTGGLSGATPSEAVSWGKIDPNRLPDAIVCYLDSTVATPILTHYALARAKRRPLKKLYFRRRELVEKVKKEYFAHHKGND